MLRVAGEKLKLDTLLKIELKADSFWRKGDIKFKNKKNLTSGARYLVSTADFDNFETQKTDAIRFLQDNEKSIKEIMGLPEVDGAELDFGIHKRDCIVQCDNFPPPLIKLAGKLGIGITLTQYPDSKE